MRQDENMVYLRAEIKRIDKKEPRHYNTTRTESPRPSTKRTQGCKHGAATNDYHSSYSLRFFLLGSNNEIFLSLGSVYRAGKGLIYGLYEEKGKACLFIWQVVSYV